MIMFLSRSVVTEKHTGRRAKRDIERPSSKRRLMDSCKSSSPTCSTCCSDVMRHASCLHGSKRVSSRRHPVYTTSREAPPHDRVLWQQPHPSTISHASKHVCMHVCMHACVSVIPNLCGALMKPAGQVDLHDKKL
eukprot:349682-Chlamydomonas_euryale.AAC.19